MIKMKQSKGARQGGPDFRTAVFAAGTALAIALVLLGGTALAQGADTARDESLRMGETKAVVDPSRYSVPAVRKTYGMAAEIPWVMDSVYCFCYCEESPTFKHKSLLSCYTEDHASQ